MQFDHILGNSDQKLFLTKIVSEQKIPHALMLHGRSGNAKLSLALALSQMIICKNPTETDSCGNCSGCKKASKLIHPDIHFVFPVIKKEGKKREETTSSDFLKEWREMIENNLYFSFRDWTKHIKAENSPPNINTRECNEVIHKLGLQTFESDSKILIIWMPEYLGKEGNRLLKLIEEPTDNTYIIVIAEDISKILGTIISRTQLLHVNPFTDQEVKEYLSSKFQDISEEKLIQLATLADGDLGSALANMDNEGIDYSDLLFEWIRISYKSPPEKLIKFVTDLASLGREQQKNFLQYSLHFFREYLFYLYTKKRGKRLNDKEFDTAQKMIKIMDLQKCESLVELLNNSIIHISRNANAKISFMADSMTIGGILRSEEVLIL